MVTTVSIWVLTLYTRMMTVATIEQFELNTQWYIVYSYNVPQEVEESIINWAVL